MDKIRKVILAHIVVITILLSYSILSFAGQAKNIILMIGDGMGPAHIHITWLYATRQLGKNFVMTEVMDKGQTAYMVNDTADSTVTESAAAATQMATGVRVLTKSIGIGPDGKVLKTILEMARERGRSTGLVTTSRITDATPGAFAAHVERRAEEEKVADQLVKSKVNILFGGGKDFFIPEGEKGRRKDGRNVLKEAEQNGYVIVETSEEMKRAQGEKILGLFNQGYMTFEIDRKGSTEPSLAEMTTKALEILSKKEQGFFLMVEGGRIDHAAHHYDIGSVIFDTLAFDEAVKIAYDFQKANPDTLLIITADHETGGLVVLPYTPTSKEYEGINLESISKIKGSYLRRNKELGDNPSPEKIKEVMKKYYDIDLTDNQVRVIQENPLKQLDPRHFTQYGNAGIAYVLRLYHRIGWATDSHSATPVFLWGIGPGSEKIKGWRHNTELFRIMKEAFGFD
jgi:alkaline phosphatase